MSLYSIARTNGGAIAWTDEQVAYIVDKYINENYTLKKLGDEFGCSYGTIKNLLHRKGYKSRGNKQGYPRNENYFSEIDSFDKAYWLGFLYANGCAHSNNNEISITLKDKEHLEKFKLALECPNHNIGEKADKRFKKESHLFYISIKDKQLHKDLIKWGCVPQKSLILEKIPNIPREYVSHFIRGYFDGDGSLHYLKNSNNYRISFCGTKKFLEDVRHELHKDSISICQQRDRVSRLQISGRKQVISILDYLYNNSTENTRLDRKYKLYLDCSEWAHSNRT